MTNRTLVVIIAAIVGCALLAPYLGVHLLTTRPEQPGASTPIRDPSRRAIQSPRQASSHRERSTSVPAQGGRTGRDLTDIEDLLGRSGSGAATALDE